MTTNNHPAHGPVSRDRLHQISEILSKASTQSDGGNLGYAMADAVKVIDVAIAAFGADPVAWRWFHLNQWHVTNDEERARDLSWDSVKVTPLYAAPPAPVVPTFDQWLAIRGDKPLGWVKDAMRESYDACRAAMLQAGNSPVTPDGWIPVSEKMPPNKPGSYEYIVFDSLNNRAHHDYWNVPDGSCDDFSPFWNHYGKYVTHWMPLPAAPQQEVK
ncbi:DUF551 domain-containing protein [Salmonella enterica]